MAGNNTVTMGDVSSELSSKNSMDQIPVLEFTEVATGKIIQLTQSMAIIEFLDEYKPNPPLLPKHDAILRARVRQVRVSFRILEVIYCI